MVKKIYNYIIIVLISNLYANVDESVLVNEKFRKQFFQKIYNEIMSFKDMNREADDAFLGESMTNVASSAPREEFIMNVDIGDSLSFGNINLISNISIDNQQSWTQFSGYSINDLGYEQTWESIANIDGNSVVWYLTGEVDAETIFNHPEWGTLLFTQLPYNENSIFPIIPSISQSLGYAEINDTSEAYVDITAIEGSYNNENLYFHLEYGANIYPSEGPLGPWHIYVMGVTNPISETGYAYAYVFGSASLLGISPGMYELYDGDYDLISYDLLPYTAIPFLNNLDIQFSLNALINRPDFGPWPNLSNSLIAIGQTFDIIPDFEDINNSEILDKDIIRSTILLDTYFQDTNFNSILDNGIVDVENQELRITYFDEDGNMPVLKQVQICDYYGENCDAAISMIPFSHSYDDSVEYYIEYNFNLLENGDYSAKFIFSDDNLNNAVFEVVNFIISNNQLGDVNTDLSIDVLDVVVTIDIILGNIQPTESQIILADLNFDLSIDVLDVIMIIDIILN